MNLNTRQRVPFRRELEAGERNARIVLIFAPIFMQQLYLVRIGPRYRRLRLPITTHPQGHPVRGPVSLPVERARSLICTRENSRGPLAMVGTDRGKSVSARARRFKRGRRNSGRTMRGVGGVTNRGPSGLPVGGGAAVDDDDDDDDDVRRRSATATTATTTTTTTTRGVSRDTHTWWGRLRPLLRQN